MARELSKRRLRTDRLPFKKVNYQIIGFGLLSIVAGYFALAQEPWNGFFPLVVAPILLVLGYCVLIPLGILYRSKQEQNNLTSMPTDSSSQTPAS
ncbi:MAG TPA: hypothetical protein VNN76_01385 [Bacteroidota bacterium]|nr:hypothetical protein [Bacteroidota bacterium]